MSKNLTGLTRDYIPKSKSKYFSKEGEKSKKINKK